MRICERCHKKAEQTTGMPVPVMEESDIFLHMDDGVVTITLHQCPECKHATLTSTESD